MTVYRTALMLSTLVVFGIGISIPTIPVMPVAWALEPCCNIVNVQPSGLVTAHELRGAKRAFQFQVNDPALLRSLRVGQPVQADLTTMRVSIRLDRLEPCCSIVSIAGKAVTPAPMTPSVRP